jgi:hypothetical protein
MSELQDFRAGIVLHITRSDEPADLWVIEAFADGQLESQQMCSESKVAQKCLNVLASSLHNYRLGSSAVEGAIAWNVPAPISKQESGQLRRMVTFFWSIVRAFLPW